MKIICLMFGIFQASLIIANPLKKQTSLKRSAREAAEAIDCFAMKSYASDYVYVSDGESNKVCGLYLIGLPDQLVELEFHDFTVGCENEGLLAIFDGWELNHEHFPSPEDHEDEFEDRYREFCGENAPRTIFVAKQNVALIQFRIPTAGEGFRVTVRFHFNPEPCNAMALAQEGFHTLTNHGKRMNCSFSMIYPETISIQAIDIGVTGENMVPTNRHGLSTSCMNSQGGDYVEFLSGSGLDTEWMDRKMYVCGSLQSRKQAHGGLTLGCQNSVVRLVSTGMYNNGIAFYYKQPEDDSHMNQIC